ncbi:crossover junction endodeoxyribonuclease RuvC [bacterium]|nr:crossover junction endodeoxyribonuclease RuvC [bacterium]
MRILGIDPGSAITGYALLDFDDGNITLHSSGSIQTEKSSDKRLLELFNDMNTIIETYKPDVASIEKLFFFKNQKTIIDVAQSRGVILTAFEKYNIPFFEYTPLEVKQILTGYGRADKKEVEKMVKIALNNPELPKLDDTVDAIAIAIAHSRNLRV